MANSSYQTYKSEFIHPLHPDAEAGQLGGPSDFWPLGGAPTPPLQEEKRGRCAPTGGRKAMNAAGDQRTGMKKFVSV